MPKGSFILFASTNNSPGLTVVVSNITISEWDGKLPSPEFKEEQIEKDTILFANKDRATGMLNGISGGRINFETEFASLWIPLDRKVDILTKSSAQRQAKRETGDVRAYFNRNEHVTFKVSEISGDLIKARSENFGEIQARLNAFEKIEFNIYDDTDENNSGNP